MTDSLRVSEESPESIAYLPAPVAENYGAGPFVVIVRDREEFSRWLDAPPPGVDGLEVRDLITDPEAWGPAAQGGVPLPVDVVLTDPAAEFSALYRLVDVNMARPVRITIPAEKPGFTKALKLAAALQFPVRLLPGQPGAEALAELEEAASFYLHNAMVEAPIEFFHSLLARLRGFGSGTLWTFLEQDPAFFSRRDAGGRPLLPADFVATRLGELLKAGAECGPCPWRTVCAGYFKWPHPGYDCAGVKRLLATLQSAADEISFDLAGGEILSPP